eukprot:366301-Chlamydomonas_euryale.AAC.54
MAGSYFDMFRDEAQRHASCMDPKLACLEEVCAYMLRGAHADGAAGMVSASAMCLLSPQRQMYHVVLAHFGRAAAAAAAEGRVAGPAPVSRIIIFTSLRERVQSIAKALERHAPLVKAKCVEGWGGRQAQ